MNGSDNKHNNESTTATAAISTTSASHRSHQHQSKCLFRWPHQPLSMSQWSSPCPFVAASVALACLVAYPWRARLSQHQLFFIARATHSFPPKAPASTLFPHVFTANLSTAGVTRLCAKSKGQWLSTLQNRYIPRSIEQIEVGCPSVAMERRCWMFGSQKDRLEWARLAALWLCEAQSFVASFVFSCYFWHCSSTGVKVFRRPALMPREMRNRGITRCVLQVANARWSSACHPQSFALYLLQHLQHPAVWICFIFGLSMFVRRKGSM